MSTPSNAPETKPSAPTLHSILYGGNIQSEVTKWVLHTHPFFTNLSIALSPTEGTVTGYEGGKPFSYRFETRKIKREQETTAIDVHRVEGK